jgi:hypothetical protein
MIIYLQFAKGSCRIVGIALQTLGQIKLQVIRAAKALQ